MRKIIGCIAMLLSTLGIATAAAASGTTPSPPSPDISLADNSPLRGVWHGTLGKQQVMVCFSSNLSSYYYLRHSSGMALFEQDADGHGWIEKVGTVTTGVWKIEPASGDAVAGLWSDPTGKIRLPISLTRIALAKADGRDCVTGAGNVAFNQPRVAAQEIASGPVQTTDGMRYRTIAALDGDVSSIELLGEPGQYDALNKQLRDGLLTEIGTAFNCQDILYRRSEHLPGGGKREWPTADKTTLFAVNGKWLTLLSGGGGDCGGAHPSYGTYHYTVDSGTGEKLNVMHWLKSDQKDEYLYHPPEKLNALIVRQAERQARADHAGDGGCAGIYAEASQDGYFVALGKAGIIFSITLPHAAAACNEDIEIPYARLQPYLSQEGKHAVRQLPDAAGKDAARPPR